MLKLNAVNKITSTQEHQKLLIFSCRVNRALLIQVTAVCPEYRRQGLSNRMTAGVLEMAADKQFRIVASESTSTYTKRTKTQRFQFEVVAQEKYAMNYANYHLMSDQVRESHQSAMLLVKRLNI